MAIKYNKNSSHNGFKKGYTPWNKNYTKYTNSKLKDISLKKKGIKHSEETKKKMSLSHLGEKNLNTLCTRCNIKICRDREYWTNYFNNL